MLSIDHQKKLKQLEHKFRNADWEDNVSWQTNEPLALIGRTGSGKTSAAVEFCRSHERRLYFSFHNLTADIAPRIFSLQQPKIFSDGFAKGWNEFFDVLKKYFAGAYHVLVFDDLDDRNDREEFHAALQSYMAADPRRNPFVILPLRQSESLLLPCFHAFMRTYTPADLRRSFPQMTDEDRLRLYSITDGMTGLLSYYDASLPFHENLIRLCCHDTYFSSYGQQLLQERFRSPEGYSGLLYAIACGKHKLSDIAAFAGFTTKKSGTYLQSLCNAGFLCTKKERSTDKRSTTRYFFTSGYMHFWSRHLMLSQPAGIAEDPSAQRQARNFIDHVLVPDVFRSSCERWFHDHKNHYEIPGYSFSELFPDETGCPAFDHIYRSGRKHCFLKIWTDLDGRYGAADFSLLEELSVPISPFYDNEYFLFSIHRFRDNLWNLSRKYDNIHLVEARFLAY